jgi:3-phenylpropionate/trans-cinnamate dioxygenase ferredoxin subunit
MDTAQTSARWTQVCAAGDLAPGGATTLEVDPPIAVFSVDGTYYAIDDTCTHETFSLAEGFLDGAEVECPLHFAKFDLRTGEALCMPATVDVRTYAVKVEDGHIFVDLSGRD